jgi:hypothetical protein
MRPEGDEDPVVRGGDPVGVGGVPVRCAPRAIQPQRRPTPSGRRRRSQRDIRPGELSEVGVDNFNRLRRTHARSSETRPTPHGGGGRG